MSFKKLKSSCYFDKSQGINRDKIVHFEYNDANTVLDNNLEELEKMLISDETTWNNYCDKQLESVQALTFPKRVLRKNISSDNIIYKNSPNKAIEFEIQNMFTANVELQILGVFWVITVGLIIDRSLQDAAYGNRLKSAVSEENEVTFSPHLMKEYFSQYQTWRDSALNVAQEHLQEGKDVSILTLDITRFFYHLTIEQTHFEEFFELFISSEQAKQWEEEKFAGGTSTTNLEVIKRVNSLIYRVFVTYTDKVKKGNSLVLQENPGGNRTLESLVLRTLCR